MAFLIMCFQHSAAASLISMCLFAGFANASGYEVATPEMIKASCSTQVCDVRIDGRALAGNVALELFSKSDSLNIQIDRFKYPYILPSLGDACPYNRVIINGARSPLTWIQGYTPAVCRFPLLRVAEASENVFLPAFEWLDKASVAAQLWQWLLGQPDNSVTPENFLLKAIQTADGDVMDGLVAASDVLKIGSANGQERNHYLQTRKLIDIRGDRSLLDKVNPADISSQEYKWTPISDNFSAWYHFFGALLYSYFRTRSSFFLLPIKGEWVARFAVYQDEYPCSLSPRSLCDKRFEVDQAGVVTGAQLARLLQKLQNHQMSANALSFNEYFIIKQKEVH